MILKLLPQEVIVPDEIGEAILEKQRLDDFAEKEGTPLPKQELHIEVAVDPWTYGIHIPYKWQREGE